MAKSGAPSNATSPAKLAALMSVLAVFFFSTILYFARIQTVWIDETTQLRGSHLPIGRLISWLSGSPMQLGVPPDRMPPISYLVDKAYLQLGFTGEFPLRLLHASLYTVGVAVLLWVIGRRWGLLAALVAGLLLTGTPQVVNTAVEIRAYPLFLGLTAVAVAQFIRLFDTPALDIGRLALFTIVAALLGYVHFFGLVAASALYCGLVVARARSRRELLFTCGSWGITLLAAAGLAPFIAASHGLSDGRPAVATRVSPREIALYFTRLIGHPAMDLFPPALGLFLLGMAGLMLLALIRMRASLPRPLRSAPADPAAGLTVAITAGLVATLVAALFASGFDALKASYSIWLVAPLAALVASALAYDKVRRVAVALVAPLLVGIVVMQVLFVAHAGWFVQSPEDVLRQVVGSNDQDVAIIYVGDEWAFGYFPMVYRYNGLSQYRLDAGGKIHMIQSGGSVSKQPISANSLRGYSRLLLVSIQTRTYQDMRQLLNTDGGGATRTLPEADLPAFADWRASRTVERPGLYQLRVTPLQRVPAP